MSIISYQEENANLYSKNSCPFCRKKNQILGCFWKKNVINKMTKKYHTVGTVPKYNRETVETNV